MCLSVNASPGRLIAGRATVDGAAEGRRLDERDYDFVQEDDLAAIPELVKGR